MLAMSLIAMVMVMLPALRKKREEAFVEYVWFDAATGDPSAC
jgi:hypothetical protein